jgi:hypothetical protein
LRLSTQEKSMRSTCLATFACALLVGGSAGAQQGTQPAAPGAAAMPGPRAGPSA